MSSGRAGTFFSERYFAEPAEVEIACALVRPVDRDQLVEIGALSAEGGDGSGTQLVSYLPWFLLGLGYRWALMTATVQVQPLFRRTGMEFDPLLQGVAARVIGEQVIFGLSAVLLMRL